MLSIKLVDWAEDKVWNRSTQYCILVKDNYNCIDWFVWRSHQEFLSLSIHLLDELDICMETALDGTKNASLCRGGGSLCANNPNEIKNLLESWLTHILNSPLEEGGEILKCFLTSDANLVPQQLDRSRLNLESESEDMCSNCPRRLSLNDDHEYTFDSLYLENDSDDL